LQKIWGLSLPWGLSLAEGLSPVLFCDQLGS
jgi:hypothetical protein